MRLKGKILAVTFLDHVDGHNEPLAATAYGRCVELTAKKIVLCYWEPLNETKEVTLFNREVLTILRSTIQGIEVLS